MKLIYRGITYDYNPNQSRPGNTGRPVRPAQSSQAARTLIYRGVTFRVDPKAPPVEAPALPANYDLIYRGTAYQISRDAAGAVTAVVQPARRTQAKTRAASATPQHQLGQVHQTNLLDNLQRRLQAAQARGDQKLIELLEAERQQINAWNN